MNIHSKAELTKALQEILDTELKPYELWRALSKALSYGDLRIKRSGKQHGGWTISGKGWKYKAHSSASVIIYSRLTGEIVLHLSNYYSEREIAIKMLDIANRT